jgi:ornithine cyclodeaminase/alanine dehydrogenase-like protein (mu-crystallin family)
MTQLEAICAVRSIKEVRIYDIDKEAAQNFAQKMGNRLGIPISVSHSPSEAAKATDIICTATVSRTPVFNRSDIAPGTHINAIGSFKPDHQEISAETILCSRLIVDHRESVFSETGDLIIPMNKGIVQESHVHAELGEVAAGTATGRKDTEEITLFKSVGSAIQDLAAATRALNFAEVNNIGTLITL